MATSLETISKTWKIVDDGFLDAYDACKTAAQRQQVVMLRDGARDAFYKAVKEKITEGDAYVETLKSELGSLNAQLKKNLSNLKDIVSVINIMGAAVKTAAALAAMGI